MSENTFTRQDKIYIVAFALQLTDEYINQPKFKDKKLITIDLPSGGTLILAGNIQDELRKLRQYWKDFYVGKRREKRCLYPLKAIILPARIRRFSGGSWRRTSRACPATGRIRTAKARSRRSWKPADWNTARWSS